LEQTKLFLFLTETLQKVIERSAVHYFAQRSEIGLPDAFCKNTGRFVNSRGGSSQ